MNSEVFIFRKYPIHYWKVGTGKPIVFLHNAGASHLIWKYQITHFSKHYTCYALDLPGYGISSKDWSQYSLSFYTEFLDHFLIQNQLTPTALIGNCLGSAISLKYALDHPQTVEKLVLFHVLTRATVVKGLLGPLFLLTQTMPKSRKLLQSILNRWKLPRILGQSLVEFQLGTQRQCDPRIYDTLIYHLSSKKVPGIMGDILADIESYERLDQIEIGKTFPNSLVLWGSKNRVLPIQGGHEFCKRAKFKNFESILGGGHLAMLELPTETNRLLEKFLNSPS